MDQHTLTQKLFESSRHKTSYIEAGRTDGPLLIFIHGWPELGLVWHKQLTHFAAKGWHCIAPDMRGYGKSSVPENLSAYELHDSFGGRPATWVGHDWGSPVVWALAAHHALRCLAVVNLCVPYFARGFALPSLLPLVDRELYPVDQYPAGQWDYFLFYRENFALAARDFEADVAATISSLYRSGSPEIIGKPAISADIRKKGGWFGPQHSAPKIPLDTTILSETDFETIVAAFTGTGFKGADAWYMNDTANLMFAATAPNFGHLELPVLFLHAGWDTVCDTVRSRFAEPMRADCTDLTEITIEGGHELQLEKPGVVNAAIEKWLLNKGLHA